MAEWLGLTGLAAMAERVCVIKASRVVAAGALALSLVSATLFAQGCSVCALGVSLARIIQCATEKVQ